MEVIKLTGDENAHTIREHIKNKKNIYFILESSKRIFEYIDKLNLEGQFLLKLKIAKEIYFDFNSTIKNKNNGTILKSHLNNLSETIQFLNENEIDEYILILDTDKKEILGDVIQQLVYLSIDIKIMLKKEEFEMKAVEIFLEKSNTIKELVINAQKDIKKIKVSNIDKKNIYNLDKEKNTVLSILNDIYIYLTEIQDKELSIAVLATKKSGKSVVINSFLGEEYAPTSLTLPTPNTCIYKKSKGNSIRLNYEGKEFNFNKPKECMDYISNEFYNADLSNENLEDMYIQYVENNSSLCSFTLIDTPGPNLAGTQHKKITYKWIEKADVIIFVIDYTKHLTEGEEKFLNDIKSVFERYGKFYSLIIFVNKLDNIYLSEEKNKSVLRFLDYLRYKLENLGYNGFFIFGGSAKQYFDTLKVSKLLDCEILETEDAKTLEENIGKCIVKYIDKDELTPLNFVENQLKNLNRFHKIENPTLKNLMQFSGIERLIDFSTYIATEKANIEVYKASMFKIDQKFSELVNLSLIDKIKNVESEKKKIRGLIDDLIEKIREIDKEIIDIISLEYLREDFRNDMMLLQTQIIDNCYDALGNQIEHINSEINQMSSEDLKNLVEGNLYPKDISINFSDISDAAYDRSVRTGKSTTFLPTS